jgi:hypothetical protein
LRDLEQIDVGGIRWWLCPSTRKSVAAPLIEAALAAWRSGALTNLKTGHRKQLYRLSLQGEERADHLLKIRKYRFPAASLRSLRTSKSRHELQTALSLAALGFPAPIPLAAGEERRGGLLRACYLLIPILEGVTDLRELWHRTDLTPSERRRLTSSFGEFSRRVHAGGFFQDDYAPNNFLVLRAAQPTFYMIDFERARIKRHLGSRDRRWMLAKLDRHMAGSSLGARMRFLKAYVNGNANDARTLWRSLDLFAPRLALRDFRRMRGNCVRNGRHFMRVEQGAWSGFARQGIAIDELVEEVGFPAEIEAGKTHIVGWRSWWVVAHGKISGREAKRIWAVANTLWHWGGLVPRPLAMLSRNGHFALILQRPEGIHAPGETADPAEKRRALTVLLDRLTAVAAIAPGLRGKHIAYMREEDGRLRSFLLTPHAIRFRGNSTPDHHGKARDLSVRLQPEVNAGGGRIA